ncbi:MAG TPA: response regulator [Candidatus Dormibacteraeota bacterium]|nr:response regulator [Candidatus Dormibacteraeota bacterium]
MSTILVVDDDDSSRLVLRSLLEPSGHVLIEAPHLEAALDILDADVLPDIVLTDLGMPEVAGGALIVSLRRHPRTTAIPLVAISEDFEAAAALHEAGSIDAVIVKPFDPNLVLQCVSAMVRKATLTRQAGGGAD